MTQAMQEMYALSLFLYASFFRLSIVFVLCTVGYFAATFVLLLFCLLTFEKHLQ